MTGWPWALFWGYLEGLQKYENGLKKTKIGGDKK